MSKKAKSASSSTVGKGKGDEQVTSQSAAEFFSEHQQIAGYDNPGKSLFTTIREFIENSLDAAESIRVLPDIDLYIEEFTELQHNKLNGIYKGGGGGVMTASECDAGNDSLQSLNNAINQSSHSTHTNKTNFSTGKSDVKDKEQMYYLVRCVDNGCGLPEDSIGSMLGRVLSGSKHGIRQTRGKFGLGAKMALIWSKKSSGLPIKIRTAHSSSDVAPAVITNMVLDIDIYRNEPRVLKRKTESNLSSWRGTDLSVTIGGNWGNYRSRILQYFQQLAVITPYAKLSLDFQCHRDNKKSFHADFDRRSDQMPPAAIEILPHPKSLNNITLSNLLQMKKNLTTVTVSSTIEQFLMKRLSGISSSIASRITSTLDITNQAPHALTSSQVAALIQLLRDDDHIKPPSAKCLSPAGEYNMRLGVVKELKPRLVATYSDRPGSHDGHPFLVEAAVSLGGTNLREGINVYRFANRIPLLFEAGADVVTQVATKRINWSSYHIDPRKDNIGVYVSIVSTKIPFKGTSKEYVGDDVVELMQSVRRAIQGCCQQLRINLAKGLALKEEQERKKTLVKYIPTISKALFNVLQKMEVKLNRKSNSSINDGSNSSSSSSRRDSKKRGRDDEPSMNDGLNNESHSTSIWSNMMTDVSRKVVTENSLSEHLQNGVDKFEIDAMLQSSIYQEGHGSINSGGGGDVKRQKVFIIPSTHLMSYGTMLDGIIRGDRSSSSSSSSATGRPHDSSLSDVVHNSTSKTKVPSTHDDVIDLTDDTTVKTIHITGKDVQKPAFKWVPFPITSTTHTIVGTTTAHFVGYVLISTEETL